MPKKLFMSATLVFLLVSLLLGLSWRFVYAQSDRETHFTGDFETMLASDRIVVKLRQRIEDSALKVINGIVRTGIAPLDGLNQQYQVKDFARLFPAAESSPLATDIGIDRVYSVHFPPTDRIREIVAAYANNPFVEYAQPVGIHKTVGITPSDPKLAQQWGLPKVQASDAWQFSQGDSSVILAIIDTGVDYKHPDLGGNSPFRAGNIWTNWIEVTGLTGVDDDSNGYIDDVRGWDWVNVGSSSYPTPWSGEDAVDEDNDPMDFNGHGTHCSGIANAITDNGTGVAGLGWGCKIMPLRVGWSAAYGGYEIGLVSMDYCAKAIYYAARNGAAAINCSWGSSNTGGIADAVTFATNMGVAVVVSAGNDDLSDASYLPSRHDCIAVAATEPSDYKASYSSFGCWVDVAAPGGDSPPTTNEVYSTYFDHTNNSHTYEYLRGTSMAAPHVVGLIGLVQSQFQIQNWRDLKARVQFTSDDIDVFNPRHINGFLGEGRINAFKAVSQLTVPTMSTIFSESFDSGLPTDWTAAPQWRDDDPGNRNTNYDDQYESGTIRVGYNIWDPPFMIVDSYHEGNVAIDATLLSPSIDCSRYSNIRLVFDNWFQNYYGSKVERGDVDVRINNGPWQTVASFIADDNYNIVDAGRECMLRLPASVDYQGDVQIRWHYYNANRENFWGIDNIKLVGEKITADRFVTITPSYQVAQAEAGDTLVFRKTIRNIGNLTDNYELNVSGNLWNTTLWDSTGNTPVSETGDLVSTQKFELIVKVEIPVTTAIGEMDQAQVSAISMNDSTVFANATAVTKVFAPGKIPWFEDFPTTIIDTTRWSYNIGPAEINSDGASEPSAPFSLNLDGDQNGGDEIHSGPIDLAADSAVIFSYYYQRTGDGESTDMDDDLWVDYYNSSGNWVNLKQYLGDGPDMTSYELEEIVLPADAYHKNFKFRFRNSASTGDYDDWFIDDIALVLPPKITVTPDSFLVTLDLGDSTARLMKIANDGKSDLKFKIFDTDAGNSSTNSTQIWKRARLIQAVEGFRSRVDYKKPRALPNSIDGNAANSISLSPAAVAEIVFGPETADLNIALLGAETENDALTDVRDKLLATGTFASITIINVHELTPTCVELLLYDGVLVWSNSSFYNSVELGDNLAEYVDAGGGVVVTSFCFSNFTSEHIINGRFRTSGYYAIEPTGYTGNNGVQQLGTVHVPNHPIMRNVVTFNGGYKSWRPTGNLTAGAQRIADWSDGKILVATKIINGQRRADIGFYPISADVSTNCWDPSTDGAILLANAICWSTAASSSAWLTYAPTSGTVPADSSLDINIKLNSADLLPDSTYSRNLMINSNDPKDSTVTVPVVVNIKPVDYYFKLTPTFRDSTGIAGDTLAYRFQLKNFGLLTDSYQLTAAGNAWPTSFWDSTGTTPLANTGPVASKAKLDFLVKVIIPDSAKYGVTDSTQLTITSVGKPALSHLAQLLTMSLGTPDTIPWFDEFPTTTLDPDKWIYNTGPAEVNDKGLNEPSPLYSLNLDGDATGGDEVRSTLIDLSADTLVILSYYYQRTGGGNSPETNEDLEVDYYNSAGRWVNLKTHPGDGPDMTNYELVEITLPTDAYHQAFQIRFKNTASSGAQDDWFVDDVLLMKAPHIEVTPTDYELTLIAGESAFGEPVVITNTGEGLLRYRIYSIPRSGTNELLTLAPPTRNYPPDYFTMELQHGQTDPREGVSTTLNAGGPDNFGYTWLDSDETGGPNFQWIDISATGTAIDFSGGKNVGPYQIGFTFPFYGQRFTTFRVCYYGYISFTSTYYSYSNRPIPNQYVYNLIAPFWDDLVMDSQSKVYYLSDGQRLVIQYKNVKRYSSSDRLNFEIILRANGSITLQYLTVGSYINSATVGIQNNDGTDGLEIVFNTDYLHDNLAILIANNVSWISFADSSNQIVPPDSSVTIPVTFSARDIDVDTVLYADIRVQSNASPDSIVVIPAKMTVITSAYIRGIVSTAGQPMANASVQAWERYPNGSIVDSVVTGAAGQYLLKVPPGKGYYTVRAFASDYIPAFVEDVRENSDNINFSLTPVPKLNPTNEWISFYSDNTTFWRGPIQIGDVVTAVDPDSVVCGIFQVTSPGQYGFMPVYRDDPTSPNIDEGAEPGDTLTFRINGYPARALGPDAPVWDFFGSRLHVDLETDVFSSLSIPLAAGWNLISWNIISDNDSTTAILADIMAQIQLVTSFEEGPLTFDPTHPELSNLKVMDYRHGYWIKMKQPDTLVMAGVAVDYLNTPIRCENGWNLVSYLPKYSDSLAHAFTTVFDKIVSVQGYDNGAMVYDPDLPQFNTLHTLRKTFGYWLRLSEGDTLTYPEPLSGIYDPFAVVPKLANTNFQMNPEVTASNEWIYVYGEEVKVDGKLLPVKTEVRALDPDGVLCGSFRVTTPGSFGLMPIYRDDPATDQDEGAKSGDKLTIYFNDLQVPITVKWTAFGDVIDLGALITALSGDLKTPPREYAVFQNYPNPFNPETTIKYQLPESGKVSLKIFDVLGQEVRTLIDVEKKSGYHQVRWDGRDNRGVLVASGIYFYQFKVNHFNKTRKMLILK